MRCAPDPNCEMCGGAGKVSQIGQVYPNEPHVADIDETDCLCTVSEDDNYDGLDDE